MYKSVNEGFNKLFKRYLKENVVFDRGPITDAKVLKYIKECISELERIGYTINDDIDWYVGEADNIFGMCTMPKDKSNKWRIMLNKFMFEEPANAIKNTIYHELAHYLCDKKHISDGTIWFENGEWKNLGEDSRLLRGHGEDWRKIAADISNKLNVEISETDTYEDHLSVGADRDHRIKFIITCNSCNNTLYYEKATNFVRYCNDSDLTKNVWSCGKCGAKSNWEIKRK